MHLTPAATACSDRTRHIRVYGYVGAPIVGGPQPRARISASVYWVDSIGLRGELTPTTCHQLDLTRARSQLFSGPQADLIGAVSNGCDAFDLGVAQRAAKGSAEPRRGTENLRVPRFAKSWLHKDRCAAPAITPSSIARFSPNNRPTQITHCGETPHQRRLSLSRSQQMKVRKRRRS